MQEYFICPNCEETVQEHELYKQHECCIFCAPELITQLKQEAYLAGFADAKNLVQKDGDDYIISDDELGIYIQAHSEDRAKKMYEEARKNLRSKNP